MRKAILLLAVAALVLAMAVPAIAQVSHETEQETDETGAVDLNTEVLNSGNSSNQCVAPLQFGNTGNLQNAQSFLQYDSEADDIEFEGGSLTFTPEQNVECDQKVQQAASASGGSGDSVKKR
jgi:spore coat protein U-like protein